MKIILQLPSKQLVFSAYTLPRERKYRQIRPIVDDCPNSDFGYRHNFRSETHCELCGGQFYEEIK